MTESRLVKKPNVEILVTAVDFEQKKEDGATINVTNLNTNFKPKSIRQPGIRQIKSEAANLASMGEINNQLILAKDKTIVPELLNESFDFSVDSLLTDNNLEKASSNGSYLAAEERERLKK